MHFGFKLLFHPSLIFICFCNFIKNAWLFYSSNGSFDLLIEWNSVIQPSIYHYNKEREYFCYNDKKMSRWWIYTYLQPQLGDKKFPSILSFKNIRTTSIQYFKKKGQSYFHTMKKVWYHQIWIENYFGFKVLILAYMAMTRNYLCIIWISLSNHQRRQKKTNKKVYS